MEEYLKAKLQEYCTLCDMNYEEVISKSQNIRHIALRQVFYAKMFEVEFTQVSYGTMPDGTLVELGTVKVLNSFVYDMLCNATGRKNRGTVSYALKTYYKLKKSKDPLLLEIETLVENK